LLSFEEGEVEWKTLGEIANFANGKGHEQDITEDGNYIVVNSKFISTGGQVKKFSDKQICPLFMDDILLVMSDLPNGKALSKTFIVDGDDKYTLNQRIGGITVKNRKEILPKFLHHYLNRNPQLKKYDNGVDQTNLRKDQILGVHIPIFSVTEQARIVAILDKFDALTNSITEGLPREIELRQKQYAYYRDLLLSFPRAQGATP
jgi:type I restriction enzyme S subunit